MAVDHRRELLAGREPLPLEALFPPRKESTGSALGLVAPELAKGLLEQLGEGPAAVEGEVLAMGEQV